MWAAGQGASVRELVVTVICIGLFAAWLVSWAIDVHHRGGDE